MKYAYVIALLLLLVSCIEVVEETANKTANETVYTPVVVKANKTVQNVIQNVSLPIQNLTVANVSVENVSEPLENETVIVDLTIAKQAKMIPLLENAVKNSSCYNLTWDGIGDQKTHWPMEVRKDLRFDYLGGQLFKGWIVFSLYFAKNRLTSETISVMVDNLAVDCPDTKNFTVDWQRLLARYTD